MSDVSYKMQAPSDAPNLNDIDSDNTKGRILDHALKLFAETGFEGTSIRALAKEADVNIAAINYHFENKENLFQCVLQQAHQKMSKEIQEISTQKEWTPEDLIGEIFDHMVKNGHMLVAVFKVFLSASDGSIHERMCKEEDFEGPPGSQEIAKAFKRSHPKAKDTDLFFAVRTLFGLAVHYAVFSASLKESAEVKLNDYKPTRTEMRQDLMRLARAIGESI